MSDWQSARKAFTLHWLSRTEKNIRLKKWDEASLAFETALSILSPRPLKEAPSEKLSPKIKKNLANIIIDASANFGLTLLAFFIFRQIIGWFYFEIFTVTLNFGLIVLSFLAGLAMTIFQVLESEKTLEGEDDLYHRQDIFPLGHVSLGSSSLLEKQAEALCITLQKNLNADPYTQRTAVKILLTEVSHYKDKGEVVLALAKSFSEQGFKTLLIEADEKNKPISGEVKISLSGGLSYCKNSSDLNFADQAMGINDNLFLLALGDGSGSSVQVFSGKEMKSLISDAEKEFQIILFVISELTEPCPYLPLVAALAERAVLMTINEKDTEAGIQFSKQRLKDFGIELLGSVLLEKEKEILTGQQLKLELQSFFTFGKAKQRT